MDAETTAARSACPACGEPTLASWRDATPAGAHAASGPYPLARCETCGSASLAPDAPPATPELYEGGVYGSPRRSLLAPIRLLRALGDRNRLRLIGAVEGERVLEVGAGRGRLTALLAGRGGDAVGIEPSEAAWREGRDRGALLDNVSLERAAIPERSRDLIILWHVIEHLDSPEDALRRIRPWLADGGRVVIAAPNLASFQARLGGDRWFHQDVPRHRTQFTAEGLRRLLDRSGFEPTRSRQFLVDQGVRGMWITLLNRLTAARDVPLRFLKRDLDYGDRADAIRDAAAVAIAGPPLLALAAVLEPAAALAGRGGCVVVEGVARSRPLVEEGERG